MSTIRRVSDSRKSLIITLNQGSTMKILLNMSAAGAQYRVNSGQECMSRFKLGLANIVMPTDVLIKASMHTFLTTAPEDRRSPGQIFSV